MRNQIRLTFLSKSENESFARAVAAFFALQLNPDISEISDIKTAVSEAVTNAIVHGYPEKIGEITMEAEIDGEFLHINVFDNGTGIENLNSALEPFFTSKPEEERSGIGFTIMRTFMDDVRVESEKGKGTKVYMTKKLSAGA